MKKAVKHFGFLVFIAVIGLILAGCGSLRVIMSAITIRSEHNLSTIRLGGTIRFTVSGQVTWIVSSTSDGSGAVADGTFITQNGVLTVSIHETVIVLYVIAISSDGERSDTKQIRIVNVTGVSVTPVNELAVAGREIQFRAQVTGTNNPDNFVTWSVNSNAAGTGAVTQGTRINANGVLAVAPNESLQTLYVTATSLVDPSVSGTVPVRIVVPTVTSVVVSPANQSVSSGRTLQFSAAVSGTYDPDTRVTWRVSSNIAGTGAVTQGTSISNNGMLTVAPNETISTLYVIATSAFDTSKFGNVAVGILIPIVTGVVVSPANLSVSAGSSIQFSAAVTGTNDPSPAVTWSVSSNAAGTGAVTSGTSINNNGLLTIGTGEPARALYIFATSVADPRRSGSVPVIVTAAPPAPVEPPPPVVSPPTVTAVTVNPSSITSSVNSTIQFNASVTGLNNPSTTVTWRVSSNAAGTGAVTPGTSINNNGVLTIGANETLSTLYVFATSTANTSISGSAAVTVNVPVTPPTTPPPTTPPPVSPPTITPPTVTSVTVNPIATTTPTNRTVQFSAMVMGANNPSTTVTWSVSRNADGTGAVTSGTSINANGLLTIAASESATILYVRATSTANTSVFGLSAVTISSN